MASVKWLKNIKVITKPFKGPFQAIDYVYYPHPDSDEDKTPVTTINVNSIIQEPLEFAIYGAGSGRSIHRGNIP